MPWDRLPGADLSRLPRANPVPKQHIIKTSPWAALAASAIPEIAKLIEKNSPENKLRDQVEAAKLKWEIQHYGALAGGMGGYKSSYDPESKEAGVQSWMDANGHQHFETDSMYKGRMSRSNYPDFNSIGTDQQAPPPLKVMPSKMMINPAPVQLKTLNNAVVPDSAMPQEGAMLAGAGVAPSTNEPDTPPEMLYTNEDYPLDGYPSAMHYQV